MCNLVIIKTLQKPCAYYNSQYLQQSDKVVQTKKAIVSYENMANSPLLATRMRPKDQAALLLENQLLQPFMPFDMLLMEGNSFGPSGVLYPDAFERIFTPPAIISLPNSHGQ